MANKPVTRKVYEGHQIENFAFQAECAKLVDEGYEPYAVVVTNTVNLTLCHFFKLRR